MAKQPRLQHRTQLEQTETTGALLSVVATQPSGNLVQQRDHCELASSVGIENQGSDLADPGANGGQSSLTGVFTMLQVPRAPSFVYGLSPPPWFTEGCVELCTGLTRTWAALMAQSVRVEGRTETLADG